jgi:hypothetical protein
VRQVQSNIPDVGTKDISLVLFLERIKIVYILAMTGMKQWLLLQPLELPESELFAMCRTHIYGRTSSPSRIPLPLRRSFPSPNGKKLMIAEHSIKIIHI